MELRVLKYFLTVAREENITRAAQALHITQPTLSRQLMQLEEELNVKLFKRSNHRIFLTEDGMLLKQRAQEILALADKAKKDFLHKEEISGEIMIGTGEFHSSQCLAQMMQSFSEEYPHVQFRIYSGNGEDVRDNIERGIFDIGVVIEPVDISKYEFVSIPEKERWGILAASDSELSKKNSVTPKDLAELPLITPTKEFREGKLRRWFDEYYPTLNICATGNLLYNEAMLAQIGMGVVLCLDLKCRYDNLKFIPLLPTLEESSAFIWKKDQIFSPAVSAFINHIKSSIEKKNQQSHTDEGVETVGESPV